VVEKVKRKEIKMIQVKVAEALNLPDAGRCDGQFTVEGRLVLSAEQDVLSYKVDSLPPYEKRYPAEAIDYAAWIGNPDRAMFLAYLDEQVAGEMRISRSWNGFAYIDDIVVDRQFRRLGVGRELIEQAKQWSQAHGLAGVMLETQNNNLAGCRLYARSGFVLAGFDRFLYRALHPGTEEIALYWYWLPEVSPAG
jgi:streptothricin acetyltransferase